MELDPRALGDRLLHFEGRAQGPWKIHAIQPVKGPVLPPAKYLWMGSVPGDSVWRLTGVTSYGRYTTAAEKAKLSEKQAGLGRPEATCAALIPIRKSQAWWELTQDQRREFFEAKSAHVSGTLKYLPAIARKLFHCHDLGGPFDFITWFEYAEKDSELFEMLVADLRRTPEWTFVEREVDVRLRRA